MIRIINRQRSIKVNEKRVRCIVAAMIAELDYHNFDVGIWLTTNTTIRKFNKRYRNVDKITDILSFPYHSSLVPGQRIIVEHPDDKNLGDIIISLEYVRDNASECGRTFDQHLIVLLAHGIAHLLNYDHKTDADASVMEKIEKQLLCVATELV